jgi:hypothetical protein
MRGIINEPDPSATLPFALVWLPPSFIVALRHTKYHTIPVDVAGKEGYNAFRAPQ